MSTETKSHAAEYADSLAETIRDNVAAGYIFGYDEDREQYGESAELSALDYLEDVLDIEYVVDSAGEYRGARILVTYGGPSAWIETRPGKLVVSWYSQPETRYLPESFTEALDETLAELWHCR